MPLPTFAAVRIPGGLATMAPPHPFVLVGSAHHVGIQHVHLDRREDEPSNSTEESAGASSFSMITPTHGTMGRFSYYQVQ